MKIKYRLFIDSVNEEIIQFTTFLNDPKGVGIIKDEDFEDPYLAWNLTAVEWKDAPFPCHSTLGVYLLLGYKQDDPGVFGLYIGKASFNNGMGYRLDSHLRHGKNDRVYKMKNRFGSTFLLEQVVAIPMKGIEFMAPALEQFLIQKLVDKSGIHLLNVVGNHPTTSPNF